jgi:transposase
MSKYSIQLTQEQRHHLEQIVRSGQAAARTIMHAQVLLKTDKGACGPRWSDRHIREALGVGDTTMTRIRHRFVQGGLEEALHRHQQPERPEKRKLNGAQEAQLIVLACSQAPQGQERWTMHLLRERLIELEIVESISEETVRTTLKKMHSNRG